MLQSEFIRSTNRSKEKERKEKTTICQNWWLQRDGFGIEKESSIGEEGQFSVPKMTEKFNSYNSLPSMEVTFIQKISLQSRRTYWLQ